MSDRILITGGSGLIGSEIVRLFNKTGSKTFFTFYSNKRKIGQAEGIELDVNSKNGVNSCIKEVSPNVVVHSAAETNVDWCEENENKAYDLNCRGTRNILDACKSYGAEILLISTSYVFNGEKEEFFEYDKTCPINVYGKTKRCAEEEVMKSGLKYSILRTDQPYKYNEKGEISDNINWVISKAKKSECFNVYKDWWGAPTSVKNISKVVKRIINSGGEEVYHYTGSDFVSRYEWAKRVLSSLGYNDEIVKPGHSGEGNHPAPRPNAKLNTEKVEKELKITPGKIENEIAA